MAARAAREQMSRRLRIRDGMIEWRLLEGQIVAVDTRKSLYMAVNPSGSILWLPLLDGSTREALVDRLVDAYGLERGDAERDVDVFVEMLEQHDLLES
jgi:hypothetical protein